MEEPRRSRFRQTPYTLGDLTTSSRENQEGEGRRLHYNLHTVKNSSDSTDSEKDPKGGEFLSYRSLMLERFATEENV